MLARIPLLILISTLNCVSGSLLSDRLDTPIFLKENPLILARQLIDENSMQDALLLTQFTRRYLEADPEYSIMQIENAANEALDSNLYMIERFLEGAVTGEATNMPELLGAITLDMLVVGDIRDLVIQGYKEIDSGEGDEVIMGLSAAGLLLTLAPELSWTPAVFKTFWKGNKFSTPFQKQIFTSFTHARKSGDYSGLAKMVTDFSNVVDSLGKGPALAIFKRVKSQEELALLARKAKFAPVEVYTLARINGIQALKSISRSGAKKGKFIKRVKLATRQNKVFVKAMGAIPIGLLFLVFGLSALLLLSVIFRGKILRNKKVDVST